MPIERLRFSEWMDRALHDPAQGYYARQVRTVGRHGDFSTSAVTSGLLGDALARWLCDELVRHPGIRTVIEVGGGDGSLSVAVRRSLGWWKRRMLRWIMVEVSEPLRTQQQSNVGRAGVQWCADMTGALESCGGHALIFHNELMDAFPVMLMQWDATEAAWREVWLTRESGAWREELEPAKISAAEQHRHVALTHSNWNTVPLRDGQRIELHAACHDWLRSWASRWHTGAMLTTDYGDIFPKLYHRQPRGTVRAYFMHHRLTGTQAYENMGRQDITADVNFTDLMTWGGELGWETAVFCTQREFLQRHVRDLDARTARDASAAFLADAEGAGTAFKTLVQRVR